MQQKVQLLAMLYFYFFKFFSSMNILYIGALGDSMITLKACPFSKSQKGSLLQRIMGLSVPPVANGGVDVDPESFLGPRDLGTSSLSRRKVTSCSCMSCTACVFF